MEKVRDGVYIWTKEELIAEQETWDAEDMSKREDFTVCPFWITTDDGASPEGFESIEDAKKSL